jgi:hypothetical protein
MLFILKRDLSFFLKESNLLLFNIKYIFWDSCRTYKMMD